MSRKKEKEPLPKPGHKKSIAYLPRDINPTRLADHAKGHLLAGWCETTGTFQLWESKGDGQAEFLGFIRKTWD